VASWNELPDPHAGDDLAYAEAWERRIPPYDAPIDDEPVPDVEYADEDEEGQLGLGVPGEQRAMPTLAGPDPMIGRVNFDPERGA
jgi:hypothetical protein